MSSEISKSEFKDRVLEILRSVEQTGVSVLITDGGAPTIELRPYRSYLTDVKKRLKGTVLHYESPLAPTDEQWEVVR